MKWWGWCREAFEAARELDRPILVDVGAVWCHWCHVMDETTYSDLEVAEFINQHLIPIKVGRDEGPTWIEGSRRRLSSSRGRGMAPHSLLDV